MIGRSLSHYRIEAELGRGGMGVVYRAFDERLRRPVALKVLAEEIAARADRRVRLLAEARAASPLNHPGIATIYDVGEEGDQLFLVMELVTGKTLRELLRQGIEPLTQVRIGAQMAEALVAAHAHGVQHGDIKPENVVVQADGRIKLLDFGVARQLAAETATLTRTGTPHAWLRDSEVAGTLAYMAPEQLRGEGADHRADLWSLGVVLFELAAGHRPFPGPTASALMTQILNDPPPRLGFECSPAELARCVHKLLEKEPERRYQSARELHVDLSNLLRDLELGPRLPAAAAGKRAVAVLPFKVLSASAEDEYLSVALADAVISHLGTSDQLLVRPTSTVMRYAKQAGDPLLAARELNVQTIVEGSIQKLGARLRVHVQAWNATDGSTVLSAKHEADMDDLFRLQDRISDGLARALGVQAPEAEGVAAPPTKNPRAYELFLRAIERLSRFNRWDTRTAIEMLENAVRLDRSFAEAWARLAEARRQLAIHFEPGEARLLQQAEREVRRALALDPTNADAHCIRGRLLWTPAQRFQHQAALRAMTDALELNPGCHQAHVERGCILFHVGLHDEAREDLTAALAAHPDDVSALAYLGIAAVYAGDYDAAQRYHERALSVEPSHFWANLFGISVVLYRQQLDRAEQEIRAAGHLMGGDPMLISQEALLWAKRGDARKANRALQRALRGKKSLVHTHHTLHNAAVTCAVLGKPAQAIALLRKAGRMGLPNFPAFQSDPHFKPLLKHPQFVRLLSELKGEWEGYRREFGRR